MSKEATKNPTDQGAFRTDIADMKKHLRNTLGLNAGDMAFKVYAKAHASNIKALRR